MQRKIHLFNKRKITYEKFLEIFQGWQAYANWADSFRIKENLINQINSP